MVELPPIHPGEVLRELYLAPLDMSAGALARQLGVPRSRVERLVGQTTAMTPDTALRLSRYFRTTPEFWMNMQTRFDLKREASLLREELDRIPQIEAA